MKYLAKPCDECPFLRGGSRAVRLAEDRIEEIAGSALDSQGATFACHKTVDYDDDGEGSGGDHCAGFLIFAEKNGNATQMMRIAERLGAYDARANERYRDLVFDDIDEMLETAI